MDLQELGWGGGMDWISILITKDNEMHNFSNLYDKLLNMFRTEPLSIIRSISTLNTVYTAIGICHTSSVGVCSSRRQQN